MEKEIDRKSVVLQNDEALGEVQIADDVVAMIASLAAMEVKGVSSMAGNIWGKSQTKGVRVDVLEGNVTVDLAVILDYGYNIPATSQKLQCKVKTAIENMTGLTCSDVNIRIAGVNMKKDN